MRIVDPESATGYLVEQVRALEATNGWEHLVRQVEQIRVVRAVCSAYSPAVFLED